MASVISDYFAALNSLDREAYLACFTESATVQDPYGGPVLTGVDGLHKFFDGMERTWSQFTMTPGEMYPAGDRVAVPWTTEAVSRSGKQVAFAGINILTLEGDKISALEGYWDFKAMVAQLR